MSQPTKKRLVLKPTNEQMEILIDYMEKHPLLANGTSDNAEDLWAVLVVLLNSAEGISKNAKAWKRTWTYLIAAARQNMKFMLNGLKDTPMTPNHVRVIDLVGYKEEPVAAAVPRACSSVQQASGSGTASTMARSTVQPKGSCAMPMANAAPYQKKVKREMVDLTDEPSTSSGIYNRATKPVPKKPSTSHEPTRSTPATAAAGAKSSTFLKAFQEKGAEMVDKLSGCFDKQTNVIENCFERQSQMLLVHLPQMIREEVAQFFEAHNANAAAPDEDENPGIKNEEQLEGEVSEDGLKEEEEEMEEDKGGFVGDILDGEDEEKYDEEYLDETLFNEENDF